MTRAAESRDAPTEPFSEVLEALDRLGGHGAALPLRRVLASTGARAHGAAILLLALPESIPAPVPSVAAVLGVPLVLVSAHLAAFGERAALPERLLRFQVPGGLLAALARRLAGPLRRVERRTRPRLVRLARAERPIGAVCLVMSVLLLLPIPLMNVPPALALVLMAWGMVQRDGAFVAAGLGVAVATTATLAVGVDFLLGLLR
jgi:hypothetical protein